MFLFNYFFILFLCTLTNQEFVLTSTNYFHQIHCNNNLHIKINSIKYFYHKYNCTLVLNHDQDELCLNQSSCTINLKPFLFFHIRHYITECRTIKLKYIRLNYTCVNNTIRTMNLLTHQPNLLIYTKNIIIICLCLIIFLILIAFLYSYLRQSSITDLSEQVNDACNIQLNPQSINDHRKIQEYELKNLSILESSSSSTITSLNNKNIITNPSEYDNLIRDSYQPSLNSNDMISSRSPFKVTFNHNDQFK